MWRSHGNRCFQPIPSPLENPLVLQPSTSTKKEKASSTGPSVVFSLHWVTFLVSYSVFLHCEGLSYKISVWADSARIFNGTLHNCNCPLNGIKVMLLQEMLQTGLFLSPNILKLNRFHGCTSIIHKSVDVPIPISYPLSVSEQFQLLIELGLKVWDNTIVNSICCS